jgi:hypothetical protein
LGQIVSDTLGHTPQASIDRPQTTFTTGKPFFNKAAGHLSYRDRVEVSLPTVQVLGAS